MSTLLTASILGCRGGSIPNRRGGSPTLDTAPKLPLCRQQKMLIERVGRDAVIPTHLPPPVMMDSTAVRDAVTHALC